MSLEQDEIGKALATEKGDLIEIKYRKPHKRETDKITEGFHSFDEVVGFSKSGDVLTGSHGSIHPNTTVKKVGVITDIYPNV